MKTIKLKSFTIQTEPLGKFFHGLGIWGNDSSSNTTYPLVYFRKPKWMERDSFNELIKHIGATLPANIELIQKDSTNEKE